MTRATLHYQETQATSSRGVPVSVGILTLAMPDGRIYQFPTISGGFGRGAAPGTHRDGASDTLVGMRYPITSAHPATQNTGMQAGGADFFIRFATPIQGRGNLGIHPDGDSHDMRRPSSGAARITRSDGRTNDGTNGCFGIAADYARQFQSLYFSLPASVRPTHLEIGTSPDRGQRWRFDFTSTSDIATQHLPHRVSARQYFPNLHR